MHDCSLTRRRFLQHTALAGIASSAILRAQSAGFAAEAAAKKRHGPIRVTDIEVHEITLEYVDWIAYQLNHFYGPLKRTIYIAHTDAGITGLGESGSREPAATVEKYIGSNPFQWIGDETSLGLGTAMYDLMGQAAGVPVYQLFGQRYRRWVPVGSWTVSTHPKRMAEAVQKYAAAGYTWMKYHLSPFENVTDQLEAMQAVAPPGFRVQFDLTSGGTDDHTPELLEKISRYPIAGGFEDPMETRDLQAYAELRKSSRLPIILHHSPLGGGFEVLHRAADAYILGHAKIGDAIRRAGLFAQLNLPFMLQNVGGNITRAMVVHMQSAFKTAHFHTHNDTETWKSDVVHERLEPVNGLVRVREKPGLGLTLNRAELERLKKIELPPQKKWIVKTRYKNGTMMYNIADPKQSIFMVRPDVRRLLPLNYDAPLETEYWDDDGSEQYRSMFARIEKKGVVLKRP